MCLEFNTRPTAVSTEYSHHPLTVPAGERPQNTRVLTSLDVADDGGGHGAGGRGGGHGGGHGGGGGSHGAGHGGGGSTGPASWNAWNRKLTGVLSCQPVWQLSLACFPV